MIFKAFMCIIYIYIYIYICVYIFTYAGISYMGFSTSLSYFIQVFIIKTVSHLQCPGRTWVNPKRDMAAHDVDPKSKGGSPNEGRKVEW